jgi:hypothetical protein
MWSRKLLPPLFAAHLVLFMTLSLFRELVIPSSWEGLGESSRSVIVVRLADSILPAQFLLIAIIAALWAGTTDQRQAAFTILLVMPAWFHVWPSLSNRGLAAPPVVEWLTPLAAFGAVHVLRLYYWRPVWFSRSEPIVVAKPWRYSMRNLMFFTTGLAVAFILLAASGRTMGTPVFLGMLLGSVGVTLGVAAVWATLMPHRPLVPVLSIMVFYAFFPAMASLGWPSSLGQEITPGRIALFSTSWSLGFMLPVVGTLLVFRRCGLRLLPLESIAVETIADPALLENMETAGVGVGKV